MVPDRVPSAKVLCLATLTAHRLAFHKKSNDGSGKCDIYYTGNNDDLVVGVLFEVSESEKANLDRTEGLGYGYDEKEVTVTTDSGTQKAVAYYATDIDTSLKPYHWYKNYVLTGAIENRLPIDYIRMIEEVESIVDDNEKRAERELKIYS
jgi:gamma-glutamylcyclotransferase (GGCT)/AIG2-like uncharacterized protein YtfP